MSIRKRQVREARIYTTRHVHGEREFPLAAEHENVSWPLSETGQQYVQDKTKGNISFNLWKFLPQDVDHDGAEGFRRELGNIAKWRSVSNS